MRDKKIPGDRLVLATISVLRTLIVELSRRGVLDQAEFVTLVQTTAIAHRESGDRNNLADAIHASGASPPISTELSRHEPLVLMAIAYLQPVTRGDLSKIIDTNSLNDADRGQLYQELKKAQELIRSGMEMLSRSEAVSGHQFDVTQYTEALKVARPKIAELKPN